MDDPVDMVPVSLDAAAKVSVVAAARSVATANREKSLGIPDVPYMPSTSF